MTHCLEPARARATALSVLPLLVLEEQEQVRIPAGKRGQKQQRETLHFRAKVPKKGPTYIISIVTDTIEKAAELLTTAFTHIEEASNEVAGSFEVER